MCCLARYREWHARATGCFPTADAKAKWELIKKGVTDVNGKVWTSRDILESCDAAQHTPEWGFPKGRRTPYETDLQCAVREFQEETGLHPYEFSILQNANCI